MNGADAAKASAAGTLAASLLESPMGLLELLGARSDTLHVLNLERMGKPTRAARGHADGRH
ncbi:MAG TPA: hypothetical protein VHP33_03280 [Polyangiaceae bacterium]|nr:hypothetical protein [Polyangiaceae bacterium]